MDALLRPPSDFFVSCRRISSFAVLRYALDPLVYFASCLFPVPLEMCRFKFLYSTLCFLEGQYCPWLPRQKLGFPFPVSSLPPGRIS